MEWSASRSSHFTPKERAAKFSLDGMLGESQSRSGRCGEEKSVTLAGNRTPILLPSSRRPLLYLLSYPGSFIFKIWIIKFSLMCLAPEVSLI
jgi:hypothetical protein